ncbi:hypothetical protein FJ930_19825 [Mesorhizobium sp. B2-4-15]|uniref:hypothetical protein n=1 Tax=Mesorhizobium sp. B2-4-15 TaxID=2589934 RepID=UPI00114DB7AC|nr:hypothetical protein [Mesorhizobium sp. B2-4-15]TPK70217.1 hypothetical protein FJ930_19825 [Mesorhizobium sp. B2-4-15]
MSTIEESLKSALAAYANGRVFSSGIWQLGQGEDGKPNSLEILPKQTNHPLAIVTCLQNSVVAQFVVDEFESGGDGKSGVIEREIFEGNSEAHASSNVSLRKNARHSAASGYYIILNP